MYCSGSKSLSSAAILVEYSLVSKCVIGPTPETPSTRLDQTVSRSFPIGVTKPSPVTATRRPFACVIALNHTDRRSNSPRPEVVKDPTVFGHLVHFPFTTGGT